MTPTWLTAGAPEIAGAMVAMAAQSALPVLGIVAVAGLAAAGLRGFPARWRHGVWTAALVAVALVPAWHFARHGLGFAGAVAPGLGLALAATWAAGTALALARWLRSFGALCRLWRAGEPLMAGVDERVISLAAAELRRADVAVPLTFGARRPVVLVPRGFSGWSQDERDGVLRHELAHVARQDWLVASAARLLSAALWWHPAVHVARRALDAEAEHAADEAVVGGGLRASDYASLLLRRAVGAAPVAALGAGTSLEDRIRSLLQPVRPSARRLAGHSALAGLGLLCLALVPSPLSEPEPHCNPGVAGSAVAAESAVVAASAATPSSTEPTPWNEGDEAPTVLAGLDTREDLPELDGRLETGQQIHEALLAVLHERSDADRREIAAAAHSITTNCPYNRAAAGLPATILRTLRAHEQHFATDDRGRWARGTERTLGELIGALEVHVDYIAALELDPLPEPQPGDYLYKQTVLRSPGLLPTSASGTAQLLADAAAAIDAVPPLVDAYDDETTAKINAANAVLRNATEKRWQFKGHLMGYRDSLVEIAAVARVMATERGPTEGRDGAARLAEDCEALIAMLDVFRSQGC